MLQEQQQAVSFQLQAQHKQNDVTPWLERTGWLPHFDGHSLAGLRASVERSGTAQPLPALQDYWTRPDDDSPAHPLVHIHEAVLQLVGNAWDAVMERCVATLDQTGRPFRQTMTRAGYQGQHQKREIRPLERLQLLSSEKRYAQVWKKFLYHLFRAAPLEPQVRIDALGLHLQPSEADLLQQLWTRLVTFLQTGSSPPIPSTDGETIAPIAPARASSPSPTPRPQKRARVPCPSEDSDSSDVPPWRPTRRRLRRSPRMTSTATAPMRSPTPQSQSTRPQVMIAVCIPRRKEDPPPRRQQQQEEEEERANHDPPDDGDESWIRLSDDEVSDSDDDTGSEADDLFPNGLLTEFNDEEQFNLDEEEQEQEQEGPAVNSPLSWRQRTRFQSLPPTMQIWLQEMLFRLSVEILQNATASVHGDVFANPLVHVAAILGIDPKTHVLLSPCNYTCNLSSLIWVARVLLLEYALPLRPYPTHGWPSRDAYHHQGRRLSQIRDCLIYRSHYPMAELLDLLAYGMKINRTEPRKGFIQWTPDLQTLYFKHLPAGLEMVRFRYWVQSVIRSTQTLFDQELMLGLQPPLMVSQLVDHLDETQPYFSFVDVPHNSLTANCHALLLVCENPPAGQRLRHTGADWDLPACKRYLQQVTKFLYHLMLSMQLTWGQSARGTELCTMLWRNSHTSPRNLVIYQGQLMASTQYHKGRTQTKQSQEIARFVPDVVARMVILYLTHVCPLVRLLLRVTGGRLDDWNQNHALFYLPNQTHLHKPRNQQTLLRRIIRESSQGIFGSFGLTTRDYRQVSIAIAKKHLPAQATAANLTEAAHFLKNIFADQAGHSAETHRQVYAVEQQTVIRLEPERIHCYRQASHLWQDWVFQPIPQEKASALTREYAMARSSHKPPAPLPLTQEPQDGTRLTYPATWRCHSLVYFKDFGLVLCALCQEAVIKRNLFHHLQKHGVFTLSDHDRERLQQLPLTILTDSFRQIQTMGRSEGRVFAELAILSQGVRCGFPSCTMVSTSKIRLHRHLKVEHDILLNQEKNRLTHPCKLQALKLHPPTYLLSLS